MLIKTLSVFCFALMMVGSLAHPSDLDDFTRLDIDQDGKLSETEFLKLATDRGGSRRGGSTDRASDQFAEADADGDGCLSHSEFFTLSAKRGSRARP